MHCKECYMPDTRPGSVFVDGVCGACRNYKQRKNINWKSRLSELDSLLAVHRGQGAYDCLIPVSGGKDSHRLVKEMLDRGMHPLLVTVNDSFTHTKAGLHNLRNLQGLADHWEYTINHDLFRRATKWAFEKTGEALKFVEYAIYTIPYMLAEKLGIELVIFGENSSYEYGSTSEDDWMANDSIRSLVSKLRGEKEFWAQGGVSEKEVDSIGPIVRGSPIVIFMSYFIPWSSLDNLKVAKSMGFRDLEGEWDRFGTIENFEQIDSQAYMVHLWLKYPKFGFQRVSDIVSRRVREGKMKLEEAIRLIQMHDNKLDATARLDFCNTLGYTEKEFWNIVNTAEWNKYYG